jgi:hypothetical protein
MEVMTVVAIRLRQSPGRENLIPLLPEVFPASDGDLRANFCLLGGFAFGILSQDGASDQEWIKILFEQIQQFISIVMTLDPGDSHQLGEYLESVFASIADGE